MKIQALLLPGVCLSLLLVSACDKADQGASGTASKPAESPAAEKPAESTQPAAPASESSGWITDYSAGLKQAAEEDKMVLLNFTGSDWCGWCIKLVGSTFSKPEFQKYADENLILVELDFPQGKAQSDAVKAQNEKLSQQYGVEGFPTLVLLNSEGKEVARNVGFLPGGPAGLEAWVAAARTN